MNNYMNLKNNANFVALSPITFRKNKRCHPDYEAAVYGNRKYTWLDIYKRATKFASALEKIGVGNGDTVSIMACNTPELYVAHYSIPMTGSINAINTRLDLKQLLTF